MNRLYDAISTISLGLKKGIVIGLLVYQWITERALRSRRQELPR
jgi:hypothetical protein